MLTAVNNSRTYALRGLSTDDKPINDMIGNGSTLYEMDTGKLFFYDEENGIWLEKGSNEQIEENNG